MKKLSFIPVLLLLVNYIGLAQNTMKDFFQNKVEVTFLGYDFTQARFIGSEGFPDPDAIGSSYLPGLNSLIVSEPKKFSIQEAFQIKDYKTSVENNKKINKEIDVASIITEDSYTLDKDKLQEMVSGYNFGDLSGIGISYIVESLNKTENKAHVYITFIDFGTKKVLHAEKVEGVPTGFGWRNFWAGAMYSINKGIKKSYYKSIYKQYM